jgi:FkbM family methyltransferase
MIKGIIKNILAKAGYRVTSTKYVLRQFLYPSRILELDFDHVISKYLIHNKQSDEIFNFIQVGAFDGVECDPLLKYLQRFNWNGIMLEPQPRPFSKLIEKYADRDGIFVKNVAISDSNGKSTLYILDGNGLPEWASGMASFDKNNILRHEYLFPGINDHIKEIEVDTITFRKLFTDHSINKLDLLQIDTEGFDAEILEMFPFQLIKPGIIHFESKHIPKRKLEKVLDDLLAKGYKIARDREEDMIAFLEEN